MLVDFVYFDEVIYIHAESDTKPLTIGRLPSHQQLSNEHFAELPETAAAIGACAINNLTAAASCSEYLCMSAVSPTLFKFHVNTALK